MSRNFNEACPDCGRNCRTPAQCRVAATITDTTCEACIYEALRKQCLLLQLDPDKILRKPIRSSSVQLTGDSVYGEWGAPTIPTQQPVELAQLRKDVEHWRDVARVSYGPLSSALETMDALLAALDGTTKREASTPPDAPKGWKWVLVPEAEMWVNEACNSAAGEE